MELHSSVPPSLPPSLKKDLCREVEARNLSFVERLFPSQKLVIWECLQWPLYIQGCMKPTPYCKSDQAMKRYAAKITHS